MKLDRPDRIMILTLKTIINAITCCQFISELVSIHKWPFLSCSAFSAGFRLRRTDVRLPVPLCGDRKPLCGLDQKKNSHFWIGHPLCSFWAHGWTLIELSDHQSTNNRYGYPENRLDWRRRHVVFFLNNKGFQTIVFSPPGLLRSK